MNIGIVQYIFNIEIENKSTFNQQTQIKKKKKSDNFYHTLAFKTIK